MTANTLKITFGETDKHQAAARERLARAEAGETGEAIKQDTQFILNFEEFSDVEQLMRRSNLTLLEAIVNEQPGSIRETAEIVNRDYKEVHRNLAELAELGVIEFDEDNGRKRPILRGEADAVDFSFRIDRESVESGPAPV